MKKILLLIAILLSALGFSQAISVSSTNYTVPQLVNNVLINSPCVSATNITWSTGIDFGSSNGLGYFQNTNPNFPMQSGVILSTGNVLNAPGPNTSLLNDGSTAWPGDTDLENTLAAAGYNMVSKNATVLEFDFTPISPNFSFDFIFASEEYGNFQCLYSDAFAFLLTNMNTGVTTNLAVVPGTNLPISVVTIRDVQYNSSCPPSVNPQFFGNFNGGSGAANSATNFNGQTTLLTASSVLTTGVPYHIKLVIADRADPQSDSAIFLSSDSFNIGQDVLGPDLTVASNTALCFGTTHTLTTGLSAAEYSFEWKKGTTVLSETGPDLIVTDAGNYTVTYTNLFSTCDPITDTIKVEYYPQISSPNPDTLYRCDMGQASYAFNLDQNTSVVKQGLPAATSVTYFATQNDANNNVSPLPLVYNSPSGATIYVRIQLPGSQCFLVKSFQLQTSPPPVAHTVPNMVRCTNTSTQTNGYFNFLPQTPIVLGSQSASIYSVSYYTSSTNANNGVSPIATPNYGAYPNNTTIYIRVENSSDPSCYSVTSFNLIVNPLPVVDVLQNVIVCNDYTLQPLTNGNYFTQNYGLGTPLFAGDVINQTQTIYIYNQPGGPGTCAASSSFKVTIVDEDILTPANTSSCGSYTLPSLTYGKYYTQPGGPTGTGTEIPAGTTLTASQLVYYYFTTTIAPICVVDSSFNVTIINTLDVGTFPDVFRCTSYILPPLTVGNYFTATGGTGTQLAPGTAITSNQTVYVYAATTGPTVCTDEDSFDVFVGINQPADISQCNGYTLPALPIGNYFTGPAGTGQQIAAGTLINNNSTIYIYAPTTEAVNCTDNLHFTLTFAQPQVDALPSVTVCETYTLPALTNGEYFTASYGAGTQMFPGDVILATQTFYIFKRLNATCANETSFTVTIIPIPAIDSRSDIDICDQYVLTPLNVGEYYTGPNGTGTLLAANTVITTSQRIYIYAISNTTPACPAQNSFQINIFTTTADSSANITECDSYSLPALTQNNKYYTQSGGPLGTGTEIPAGTVITTSQTIYIFKESTIRTSFSCIDETSFTVTINHTPVLAPIANVVACNSYTLPALTVGDYYTGGSGDSTRTLLHAGDVLTSSQTVYVYAHTATSPDCSSQINFTVTIYNVDELPNVTICENYTLPTITNGKFYTGTNGTGTLMPAGSVINTSMTVYIYGTSPFLPRCSDESSFTVTIIDTPVANAVPASLRTVCDQDGTNDGITTFNLTTLSATILGTQTGTEFEINYYESLANATTGTNPVTSTAQAFLYVRVKNNLTANCYDVKPITIIVNKLPQPTPIDGIICIDSETGNLLNPYTMHTGLTNATHHFVWTNEAGATVGTSNSYQAILPGVYTVVATSIATGCSSDPVNVTVTASEPALVTYEVSEDFADSQSITVTATGQGNNFEYQLDNGPFQDSNIFNNVASGMHTVTVRDKNGCGSTTIQALVVNYPKYFTPNGDGYNDSWNIRDLSNQPSAKIEIYDRYGKMICQIRPSNSGWDGTYNGRLMPSDDYWFSVSYTDEHNVAQQFRAHFAMKR